MGRVLRFGRAAGVILFAVALVCGCTGRRSKAYSLLPETGQNGEVKTRAQSTLAHLYPPQYRATQRAIITLGRKQFVCDGVLTVSPKEGHHLAVISTLGLVTELQVNTNRSSQLLKVTPLFREDWSREYVAREIRRLFAPRNDLQTAGRLPDGRFVLESPPSPEADVIRYIFTPTGDRLQEVEVARHGKRLYQALVSHYQKFAGFPTEIPSEFKVIAPAYRLELRTAEMVIPQTTEPSASASASARP